MRIFCTVLLLLGLADVAVAETIPLPRPRPQQLNAAVTGEIPAPADEAEAEPPPPSACFVSLSEHAVVQSLPDFNEAGCAVADAVRIEAIILPDQRRVAVQPAGTLRCEMAAALTDWVRDVVAPVTVAHLGSPLRAVENFDSFSCRSRNRIKGAKLSEHGKGNAFDLRSLKLANGTVVRPADQNLSKDFRDGMRMSACGHFRTVLGPDSDGYHQDHIHLDIAERKHGYRMCQWDVLQPFMADALFMRPENPAAAAPLATAAGDKARPAPIPRRL